MNALVRPFLSARLRAPRLHRDESSVTTKNSKLHESVRIQAFVHRLELRLQTRDLRAHLASELNLHVLRVPSTDAVYVFFTASVAARHRYAAASWSSVWYLLSAFAVISYTSNWAYVLFAALGSWIGGFLSIAALDRASTRRE